ncbi:MAG TPA: Smr/MutS family protein [bacterium]|nr:Smr/MutS family protein [bacterium]
MPAEPTRFEEPEPGGRWMEEALRDAVLDVNAKFQGAPQPVRKGRARRAASPDLEPDAELDLHGKTQEAALRAVSAFVRQAHGQRLRHVLLITGKGQGSGPGGPVLRQAVQHWLERHGGPYVKDFHAATPRHGGDGAWWVWMK